MNRGCTVSFLFLLAACGGVVEPQADAAPTNEDAAATSEDATPTGADAGPEAETSTLHFACLVLAASTPTFVECTTLADGGASYVDEGNVDCRTYYNGAGQGCVPPMPCTALVDGEALNGNCAQEP